MIYYPLLGERVNGPIGEAIDIIAILVTLIGVAVSLGQGGLQIGARFDTALGYSNTLTLQLIIIVVTAVAYMLSAATPINVGVKWLSNISFIVGGFLVVYLLIVGPTVSQINAFTQGIGDYLQNLLHMSLNVNVFNRTPIFSASSPASTGDGGSPGPRSWGSSPPGSRAGAPSGSSSLAC